MGSAAKVGLAVLGGYVLGRTKKMKMAIMLGGALAGRKLDLSPTDLLGKGAKMAAGSADVARLREAVSHRLLDAGRDAALSAAANRMESLTDTLVSRVENLGKPVEKVAGTAGDVAGAGVETVGDTAGSAAESTAKGLGRLSRRRSRTEEPQPAGDEVRDDEDETTDSGYADDADDTDDAEDTGSAGDTAPEDGADEEPAPGKSPARRPRRRTAASSSEGKSGTATTSTSRRRTAASSSSRSTSARSSQARSGGSTGRRSARTTRGGDDG